MSEGNDFLPDGWVETSLGDLGDWKGGGTPSKSNSSFWTDGNVPWVSPKDMKRFYLDDSEDKVTEDAVKKSCARLFPPESVLVVTRSGILERILPVAINRVPVATNQDIKTLIPEVGIESGYVAYFLMGKDQNIREKCAKAGTTVASIDLPKLKEYRCIIPPSAEQKRIVTKIEALQERSRRAREALAEVAPLLEQFRQSLMAAAFRGDLTADWRAANPNVESASELLNRIRQERRQQWEQSELAKFETKGKQPPKDWQQRYQEPEPINGTGLPALPKSWCWARAEEVCAYITKGTTPPKESMTQEDGEVRFLKVGNLTFSGALDFSKENAYIDSATHNSGVYARSRVYPGDVLMNLVGPPLGKVSVIPANLEQSNVNQAIAIFRPLVGLDSSFLTMVLTTPTILDRIVRRAKQTSGQRNLTLDLARGLPIPLAPIAEQVELARRLKQSLSSIESLESDFSESEAELTQLNQSILAKALRGELVPQDPHDEPASELLARIRRMRDAVDDQTNSKALKASKKTRKKSTSA